MKTLALHLSVCLLLVTTGCAQRSVQHSHDAGDDAPQLVVAIVYDQFPQWFFANHGDALSPEGAVHRLQSQGATHVVEYAHAGTHTAPGHAAIATGVPPSRSGVPANSMWTDERGIRSVVDGGIHPVHGLEDAYASPSVLRVDSVADALRKAHGATTRIAALSFKKRCVVLTAGRDPDLALWYEPALGAITSSSYYGEELPSWAATWIDAHPIDRYFTDWEPRDAELLERLFGPDDAVGEADYRGLGRTFPHNPATTTNPKRTFRVVPQSTEYLLELARVAVAELELGRDGVPDLLVLSISGTDYAGHVFGPESWEYLDSLYRIDEAVGRFLTELERTTRVAALITSDHGVARLPERSRAENVDAVRIYPDLLQQEMNAALVEVLGEGEWVGRYEPPFVYLTAAALADGRRETAMATLIAALESQPGVLAAHHPRTAAGWTDSPDPVRRAVAAAIHDPDFGGAFVVYTPGSIHDEGFERGKGTAHGSPWDYDRQVPVLFSGPGVTHTSSTEPLEQGRVAATLCSLLGVEPPEHLREVDPLPGASPRGR